MMATTPMKAIREKCLDCCCGSATEVNLCTITDCALYPFRMGKNPYRKNRERSPEELEALRERGKAWANNLWKTRKEEGTDGEG